MIAFVVILLTLLTLDAAVWCWGADSRQPNDRDKYWWPNGYDELHRTQTKGLRYATYKLEDGVTFVHIATIETDDGESPLGALQTFAQFQDGVEERCEEPATAPATQRVIRAAPAS
jgi:hypothetical protein